MTLSTWANILCRRYPREQYQQNVKLLLDIFNINTRHEVNAQSFVQLKINPESMQIISTMSEAEITLVKQLLLQNIRGIKLQRIIQEATRAVRTLYQTFYTVTSRVKGSPGRFRKMKSQLDSIWNVYGEWTCAFNVNPAPMTSQAFFKLAGASFELPNKTQRWILLAQNPVAAAQYFICFMDTFADVMLGWPKGAKKQRERGIAGDMIAWGYKPECTERAVLHAHAVGVQTVMLARRFQCLVKNPDFQQNILAFMESVTQSWLPSPYYCCSTLDETKHDQTCNVDHKLHGHTKPLLPPLRNSTEEPQLLRPSIPISETEKANEKQHLEFVEWLAACAINLQWHFHTATCGKNGFKACDEQCRVSMPRVVVRKSHLYEESSLVLLRRDIPEIASYNMAMLAAEPCNHAFYLMAHCDVFWREYNNWLKNKKNGVTTAEAPIPPNFADHAAEKAEYASGYVSKPDLSYGNDKLINIADCLNNIRRSENEPRPNDNHQGRTFLAQTINTVHGRLTYPASIIAAYLLGENDFTLSCTLQPLDLKKLMDFIQIEYSTTYWTNNI